MDVFSLLKFWRNAGIGDPINPSDLDITDDEGSFFDLVFTHPNNIDSTIVSMDGTDLKSNKRKILPLDTTKAPKSPFRSLLGLQNKVKVKEMKCEIEQVTISSLLSRDNSLRHKLKSDDDHHHHHDEHMTSKRFSKDVVHKYLNLMKPKGSKRGSDKVRCSEQSQFMLSPRKEEKLSGKITVFKEVRKHLGKSRSSSSSNAVKAVPLTALRRDDSALQQHDGIQSAILHCKKSYNSPSQGCNVLSRSGSAPSHGSRISVDEEKRSSI